MTGDDDLILPFERRLNIQTDVEMLATYLLRRDTNVTLSVSLQEKLARLEICRDLIRKYRSKYKVVPEMANIEWTRLSGEKYKLSKQQAYRDFDETVELFNTAASQGNSLDFYVDLLLGDIQQTREKAFAKGDYKTVAMCERNVIDVLKNFFGGQEARLYDNLQPPVIITNFSPESTGIKIPDDWEGQVKRILAKKKRKEMTFDDADIIDDTEPEPSE